MEVIRGTDPAFTLRVYAHSISREPQERERLRGLVEEREVIGVATLESERHRRDPTGRGERVAVQLGTNVAR